LALHGEAAGVPVTPEEAIRYSPAEAERDVQAAVGQTGSGTGRPHSRSRVSRSDSRLAVSEPWSNSGRYRRTTSRRRRPPGASRSTACISAVRPPLRRLTRRTRDPGETAFANSPNDRWSRLVVTQEVWRPSSGLRSRPSEP